MSYILEALRKLEKEKSRAQSEIDPMKRLVVPDGTGTGSVGKALVVKTVLGVSIAIVLVGGTYVATRHVLSSKYGALERLSERQPDVAREGGQSSYTAIGQEADERSHEESSVVLSSAPKGDRGAFRANRFEHHASTDDTDMREPIEERNSFRGRFQNDVDHDEDAVAPIDGAHETARIDDTSVEAQDEREGDLASEAEIEPFEATRDVATTSPRGSPDLKISAIAWSPDDHKRFAVVNLKSVREGDSIEGALVASIQEDGIILKWRGVTYKLLMGRR